MPPSDYPPTEFAACRLPLETLAADEFLYRSHRPELLPLYFSVGNSKNRFDDPAQVFGVCYCARSPEGAFVETFLRQSAAQHFVDEEVLEARSLALLRIIDPLRVVRLHGDGLVKLGTTARVSAGDMGAAQAWARAIYDHPDEPDGILYRVRHDDDAFGIAVFDRAEPRLSWMYSEVWRYSSHLSAVCERYELIL
ncbi:RES family NAD+ phosphorylase [Arhodomonas sp. SL1]|uniref:RES family NAD+ phosphorylase n=1 Tax=Arhodomonas sp. SL1 TaxID=3425691 RepID=UPI003F8839DE